jgi:DNA topoisomerase 2-associated protein PAT1
VVFLRIGAVPKGGKLLSFYLQLVTSGSEVARIAFTAVYRYLRTIFGIMQTITKLASGIYSCTHSVN